MGNASEHICHRLHVSRVPSSLMMLLKRLQDAGYEAFCVGGAVRDLIMGRPLHDWDVATSAFPEQVVALFDKVVETGIDHGTVTVVCEGTSYEVTTYRIDVGSSDGRHPDDVKFTRNLEEDLKRRDFTMNAMAWNPLGGIFVDPHHGCKDIALGLIRAVGHPYERLSEDGLRSLRGVRFASTLGFSLESQLTEALSQTLDVFRHVSVERIWQELYKLLLGQGVEDALDLLRGSGMWTAFWPDTVLDGAKGLAQLPASIDLRLAHLFRQDTEAFSSAARTLKLPKKLVDHVSHLLDSYGVSFDVAFTQVDAMRVRANFSSDVLRQICTLARAQGTVGRADAIQGFLKRISNPPFLDAPLSIKDLPINGRWIQEEFKIKPSPQIGVLLAHCLEESWAQPERCSVEGCREMIEAIMEQDK